MKWNNKFDRFIENCNKDMKERLGAEGEKVVKKALRVTKQNTPVRQNTRGKNGIKGGTLKRSWKVEEVGALKWRLYNNTEYAIYVEHGHRIKTKTGQVVGVVPPVRMLQKGLEAAQKNLKEGVKGVFDDITQF